jgi:hypothetical protein
MTNRYLKMQMVKNARFSFSLSDLEGIHQIDPKCCESSILKKAR